MVAAERRLIPYCRSALNSLSPNALVCPAVEPHTRAGLFRRQASMPGQAEAGSRAAQTATSGASLIAILKYHM
jgi:hypothetical protein